MIGNLEDGTSRAFDAAGLVLLCFSHCTTEVCNFLQAVHKLYRT